MFAKWRSIRKIANGPFFLMVEVGAWIRARERISGFAAKGASRSVH